MGVVWSYVVVWDVVVLCCMCSGVVSLYFMGAFG